MSLWSRLLGVALLTVACACTEDFPLTVVLGVDWNEAPTVVEGEERWRTFRLEADSLVVTQHCGETEVEATVPAAHRFIVFVTERTTVNTVVGEDNCMATYTMAGFELALDSDGEVMRTIGRTEGIVLQPYTDVNGIFGGRTYVEEGDVDVEWFFTPTTLEAVARCPNNLTATASVPVDLEHYFEIDEADAVSRREGSCEVDIGAGTYRYVPDEGELGIRYGGLPEIRLV